MQEIKITENQAGQRFDKFLFKYFKEATSGFIYKMLRKKNITLNDKKADGSEKLQSGDSVKIFFSDETLNKFSEGKSCISNAGSRQTNNMTDKAADNTANEPAVRTDGKHTDSTADKYSYTVSKKGLFIDYEKIYRPLDIVYEDEDVLVINKPPNMPTHPSMGNYENSLANGVMYYYKSKGEERVFSAVNRLDKDTSGLMAVAKNSYIHARLGEEIQKKELKRKYMCIVCGDVEHDGTVDAPIRRADGSVINRIVAPDGQRAVKRYREYTLLEMELETGRTHQIRVHMAYIGHPLVGDWLYGTENHNIAKRQMLHSCYLCFTHPITGQIMEFKDEMAEDMRAFIEKLS